MPSPLMFIWQGDAFTPIPRHAKECDVRFVIGERYQLEEILERSSKSHAQYFCALKEGWMSLPESMAHQFATPEHLRKFALIRTGFHDKRSIVAGSKAEAQRLAAFIRPMDDYAIVIVEERVVTAYTAQSQSYRAMGKAKFQESKQAVLDYIDGLLSVENGATAKAGSPA